MRISSICSTNAKETTKKSTIECWATEIIIVRRVFTRLRILSRFRWRRKSWNPQSINKRSWMKKLNLCLTIRRQRSNRTTRSRRESLILRSCWLQRTRSLKRIRPELRMRKVDFWIKENSGLTKICSKKLWKTILDTQNRRKCFFWPPFN